MPLKTTVHKRIETRDKDGNPNGWLLPIYNIAECAFLREPKQVYLTTVNPGQSKGPHLHYIRNGLFTCIKGDVRIVVKVSGQYEVYYSGETTEFATIEVPHGNPALIQNVGKEEAWVLNMPSPEWTPGMNDEHTADFSDCPYLQVTE